MRKDERVVVIKTDEEAEAMLQILEAEHEHAQKDDYAAERNKPIKRLSCACCGTLFRGRQWFNQDTGYGLCDRCVRFVGASPEEGVEDESYGVAGIHFLIPELKSTNEQESNG